MPESPATQRPPSASRLGWGPRLLAATATACFLAFLAYQFWPNDEAAIRSRLKDLSETLSRPEKLSVLGLAGKANHLKEFLTKDCRIEVGHPVPMVEGADNIVSAFLGMLRSSSAFTVRFSRIRIELAPDRKSAAVHLEASATRGAGTFNRLQERPVRLTLVLQRGVWRLAAAESGSALITKTMQKDAP